MSLSFLEESSIPNDYLNNFRKKAWDTLSQIGLPNRKHEKYQYVPLAKLYAHEFLLSHKMGQENYNFSNYILPCNYLVFVNGFFHPHLSVFSEKIEVYSLKEAMNLFAMFLQNRYTKSLKEEIDPFALMNTVFHKDGLFIYVPNDVCLSKPLQILNFTLSDEQAPSAHFSKVQIFMGKNSSMDLVLSSHHSCDSEHHLMNASFDIHQEDSSKLSMYELIDYPKESWYFGSYRHQLKSKAQLNSIAVTGGSKTVRRDCQISLLEERAYASTSAISFLTKERHAHTNVLIKHQAPSCVSNQLFKTILKDQSKSSFEGKIFVEKEAQKTQAYQLNNNLILSDDAKCFSKPNLEIFADDVKASHGATIGRLSDESIFYLQSRGVCQHKAKKMLLQGFYREILDEIPIASFKTYLENIANETN